MIRLRLLTKTLTSSLLLVIILCLGAQNNQKPRDFLVLNLGIDKSVSLPSGYWLGGSIVLGLISGGFAAALLMPIEKD